MRSLSVIVPAYNEEGNVKPLHAEIVRACADLGADAEIIFVDDGSTDGTLAALKALSPVKIIALRKNFGQTAAFDAGLQASKGEILVTLDGDGQDDPADIPLFLARLDEGFDMVVGWRKRRMDSLGKRFVSRAAHALRRIFVKDGIHDSGSSFKAMRREAFDSLELYGEMHRFIPGMLAGQGFRVGEVETRHRRRVWGKTKYGISRAFRGFLDMMSVSFWRSYSSRPLHLFGGIGLALASVGGLLVLALFVLRLFRVISLEGSVWPIAGFFLVLAGMQLFATGLLADIAAKGYYHARKSKPYAVREIIER